MEKDNPKPDTKPAGSRPPPRPPHRTAVGLCPEDDFNKKRSFTVTKSADGEGKFIRQSGGVAHHGHVIVRVAPNVRGKGITINSEVSDRAIPERYIKPVTDMIREALEYGYENRPVIDIIVRIVGGSWDKDASDELAFRMAGIFAIKDAVRKAEPMAIG
jgi:elongation factor G